MLIYIYKALWVLSAISEHKFAQLRNAAMEQGCRQPPQAESIPCAKRSPTHPCCRAGQHPPKHRKPAEGQEQTTQLRHRASPSLTQEPISNSVSPLACRAMLDCSLGYSLFLSLSIQETHPEARHISRNTHRG